MISPISFRISLLSVLIGASIPFAAQASSTCADGGFTSSEENRASSSVQSADSADFSSVATQIRTVFPDFEKKDHALISAWLVSNLAYSRSDRFGKLPVSIDPSQSAQHVAAFPRARLQLVTDHLSQNAKLFKFIKTGGFPSTDEIIKATADLFTLHKLSEPAEPDQYIAVALALLVHGDLVPAIPQNFSTTPRQRTEALKEAIATTVRFFHLQGLPKHLTVAEFMRKSPQFFVVAVLNATLSLTAKINDQEYAQPFFVRPEFSGSNIYQLAVQALPGAALREGFQLDRFMTEQADRFLDSIDRKTATPSSVANSLITEFLVPTADDKRDHTLAWKKWLSPFMSELIPKMMNSVEFNKPTTALEVAFAMTLIRDYSFDANDQWQVYFVHLLKAIFTKYISPISPKDPGKAVYPLIEARLHDLDLELKKLDAIINSRIISQSTAPFAQTNTAPKVTTYFPPKRGKPTGFNPRVNRPSGHPSTAHSQVQNSALDLTQAKQTSMRFEDHKTGIRYTGAEPLKVGQMYLFDWTPKHMSSPRTDAFVISHEFLKDVETHSGGLHSTRDWIDQFLSALQDHKQGESVHLDEVGRSWAAKRLWRVRISKRHGRALIGRDENPKTGEVTWVFLKIAPKESFNSAVDSLNQYKGRWIDRIHSESHTEN